MTVLDPPVVSADDRGFLLGDGLFETIRLYRGRPFRLAAHLRRLAEGAGRVGIDWPPDLEGRVERSVAGWGGDDGALRITLTRGGEGGVRPEEGAASRAAIRITPWRAEGRWYEEGLRAHAAGVVASGALTAGLKTLGYLERVQAVRTAVARGGDEALLSDERGALVEGSASNLLVVEEGRVLAPGPAQGALPGITREVVLARLRDDGFEVAERTVPRAEAHAAAEILLTSSLREVVPVVELDGRPVGEGCPGPVFRAAVEGLRARVAAELDLEGSG